MDNTNFTILLVIFFVVCIALAIGLYIVNKLSKNKKATVENFDSNAVDIISMENIVSFFKRQEVIEKLKENENLSAVAIKEKANEAFKICCTLFDKSKNEVVADYGTIFESRNLSADLEEAFGKKSMIILQ